MLLLVGPASREEGLPDAELHFVASLKQLARAGSIDGTVRFAGRTDDVHDYMGAADLFVFLSRREGLPIVAAEAMASGLPCILSPLNGAAAELVEEEATGFIVNDPDDPDSVAPLISRLLSDQALRIRLGEQARRIAVRRFSFETRAAALADLYREVAERRRR